MTKYVIGTISDMDTPLLPPYKGAKAVSAWYSGITDEMLAEERGKVLAAQPEDIRALAKIIRAILSTGSFALSVIQRKSRKNKELFGSDKEFV